MCADKVKVAIRVRPFNRREIEMGTKCVVEMSNNQTHLYHPNFEKDRKPPKTFAFDNCFWSFDENDTHFAGQQAVYKEIGVDILDNAFQGYNACIFAYGQTGSGKSFTMMGGLGNTGLIPRLCDDLFDRIAKLESKALNCKVEVSYMEIYNEKVHDLLDPKGSKQCLRVREHNILGPYVDGLSLLAVSAYQDIDHLMQEGNKSRTVAATNMNSESSRSHAVFNVILTQTLIDEASGVSGEKVSKLSLVDLAGSERAVKTGAVGDRLKEGSNINKSLTTLGLVISKLADQTVAKDKFVPYRDSVLTWLLKDNLGGNSKTVMVATISPAADNYEESLSTLRYADRAKRIVNHAVINEDPNARIIRELREEVEFLREQLKHATGQDKIKEKLHESEKFISEMSRTWEEKLRITEQVHQERQHVLEKMGISVEASGIKVEQNKYYLVNLNEDPSLNELLVYYLKERTLVGRPDAEVENDIQLSGLGIMVKHCVITLEENELFLHPIDGARTCVNGSIIGVKTALRHGDRVLWGNNHFFRVNCPKSNSPTENNNIALNAHFGSSRPLDFEFAREELMTAELENHPISNAMRSLEKQHEKDKQGALEQQRQMYERQLQTLRNQMSPSTPYAPYTMGAFDPLGLGFGGGGGGGGRTPSTPTVQSRIDRWAQERPFYCQCYKPNCCCHYELDDIFKKSLSKLREDIVKANALVREANFLAEEMVKQTEFRLTLQIPAANLSPNRRRGAFVSEPAILVRRKGKASQVWSMDKLENKLINMRDAYERKDKMDASSIMNDSSFLDQSISMADADPQGLLDPFYEPQEDHNLVGVANVFLEVLFHNVKLDYHVPIISQQGEVAGRLHVQLCRVSGYIGDRVADTTSEHSGDNGEEEPACSTEITCRVVIKEATGLPPSLSHFVFCQYSFWGHGESIVVPPVIAADKNAEVSRAGRRGTNGISFHFDHGKDFKVNVTEEFLEHCNEGALSIEVWGHRSAGFGSSHATAWELDTQLQRSRSLADRWSELSRKIELWVEIHELNDQGYYAPVEVQNRLDMLTGGMYQLRQGQQRRVVVRVQPVQNSGTLPLICETVTSVSIGCVCLRRVQMQKPLDSYQEDDLTVLRDKWSEALDRRKDYLDEQMKLTMNKTSKSEREAEREQSLIDQWVNLQEERNAVLVPAAGSDIPGAPAQWSPPQGMEQHIPVIFLDLNADDMSTTMCNSDSSSLFPVAGQNSLLPKEHGSTMFNLPIVKFCDKEVCAIASWDSSIHDSAHLNRPTAAEERVYLILKAQVRLSHPAPMDLVLRKRLAIHVYKKQSITDRIKKHIVRQEALQTTGVTYEIVSNVPKASEELEDRESLAQMAALGVDSQFKSVDGESYIEKYTKGVCAVESILSLDKLRQEVAVKELLAAQGRSLRKTVSVPNISQFLSNSRLDIDTRADSVSDIASGLNPNPQGVASGSEEVSALPNHVPPSRPSFAAAGRVGSGLTAPSPQAGKMIKPMRTLLEEQFDTEIQPLMPEIASRIASNSAEDGDSYKTDQRHPSLPSIDEGFSSGCSQTQVGHEFSNQSSTSAIIHTSQPEDSNWVESFPRGGVVANEPSDVSRTSILDCVKAQCNGVLPSENNCDVECRTREENSADPVVNGDKMNARMAMGESRSVSRENSSASLRDDQVMSDQPKEMGDSMSESTENWENDSVSDKASSVGDVDELGCANLPLWLAVGESVLVKPYSMPGVISFIGKTHFATGVWIGVELDAPKGKNDGSVGDVQYFSCRPKHGIFVRCNKLYQDRHGKTAANKKAQTLKSTNRLAGTGGGSQSRLSGSMVDLNSSNTVQSSKKGGQSSQRKSIK